MTCPECGGKLFYDPPDPNADCDADGNRGKFRPGITGCNECEYSKEDEPETVD